MVGLIVWALIAPMLAAWLVVERPLATADAIMVLSGSSAYKERTQKAAEFYRAGAAPAIYITNDGERSGWSQSERTNLAYVELERRELIANGVAAEAIRVLPGQVSGTIDEAKAIAGVVERDTLSSLLIVTSAHHTRRALRTFEEVLAGTGTEIGIAYAESSVQSGFWWLSILGWQTVGLEYVKLPVYWAFY